MRKILLFITFILMAVGFQLNAQTIVFDGDIDSDWNTAANWDGDVLPGTGNDVDLDGKTVVLSGNATVQRVYASGSSNLTINSGITLTVNNTAVTADGNGALEVQGSATVTNNGTINIANTAGTSAGHGYYNKGTTNNNGTIAIDGVLDHGLYVVAGTFTNGATGIITITNVGDDNIYTDDANSGTLFGNLINDGSITVTMTNGDDGVYVNDGSTFTNNATLIIHGSAGDMAIHIADQNSELANSASGTITVNGSIDYIQIDGDNDSSDQALLNNSGTITFNGSSTDLLRLRKGGRVTNNAGGIINVNNAGDEGIQIDADGGTITNAGTINVLSSTDHSIEMLGGTITNQSGGLLQITSSGDKGILLTDGAIDNSGTIVITGATSEGVDMVGGTFNNNSGGLYKATNSGDDGLEINNAGFTNDGAIEIDGSASEDIETFSGFTINNTANATYAPGSSLGDMVIRGDFDLGASTTTFEINGTTAVTDYDQIQASILSNTFTIGASTKINLVWGFTPTVGDKFQIIDAAGTLSGAIDINNVNSTHTVTVTVVGNDLEVEVTELNSTWTGNNGVTWSDALNWSDGIPTATTNVTIPSGLSNYPTASSAVTTNGITMASGSSFIANSTVTGNVTYNRTLGTTNWYLVSSPVSGETMTDMRSNNAFDTGSGSNIGFAPYTTADDSWSYFTTSSTDALANGTGYSAKLNASGDISFTGTINTADVNASVSFSGNGFNLVGNPYTAHINSKTFLDANSNLDQTQLWVWNQASGMYEVKTNASAFILAPTQGFFVKANSGTQVTFGQTNQVNTGGTFQKSATTEVKLLMTDGESNRFAKIYYLDNTTKGFDTGYEGEVFGGIKNSLDVFSQLVEDNEGKNYQVQSLPVSEMESTIVPLGLTATANKEITFSVETLNLPEGIKVFLEDRKMNVFTNLNDVNYKVTLSEAADGVGRFYLHTSSKSALSVDDNLALDNISIFKTNATTLRIVGLQQGKSNIKLYNVLGKQILTSSFEANGVKDISLPNLSKGVYIVQLETTSGNLNKKIVLE